VVHYKLFFKTKDRLVLHQDNKPIQLLARLLLLRLLGLHPFLLLLLAVAPVQRVDVLGVALLRAKSEQVGQTLHAVDQGDIEVGLGLNQCAAGGAAEAVEPEGHANAGQRQEKKQAQAQPQIV
jgi:hypothetical protein